jgi:hypothetical protein
MYLTFVVLENQRKPKMRKSQDKVTYFRTKEARSERGTIMSYLAIQKE